MKKNKEGRLKKIWDNIKFPLFSVILSFGIGALFIIWSGNSPVVAYEALFKGSLLGMERFGETLYKTIPLIFTGLSIAFAFRTGLFNIGAEGQYLIGAITTVAVAYIFRGMPRFILIPLVVFLGAVGGALWASIAGFLKAKLGVHEVITTIMMNYISLHFVNLLVRTKLNPSVLQGSVQKAHSVIITDAAKFKKLSEFFPSFGYSSVHTGLFLAIVCAIIVYFILFKTTIGYEIRSVGHNPFAAEYGGISISKNIILSMAISGALAGLAGVSQVAGLIYKVDQSSASPGYGFTGIAVALLGKNHPVGVVVSALLFGVLSNGARKMQMVGIPKEVVGIIQGVIILFIAGEQIVMFISSKRKKKNNGSGEVA